MENFAVDVNNEPNFAMGIWRFIQMPVEDYHNLSFTTVAKNVHTVKGYTLGSVGEYHAFLILENLLWRRLEKGGLQ